MTTKTVTKRLAEAGYPEITMYRGDGYHYFVWDDVDANNVYDSESVMIMQFRAIPISQWVEDGIAFGEKVKAKYYSNEGE